MDLHRFFQSLNFAFDRQKAAQTDTQAYRYPDKIDSLTEIFWICICVGCEMHAKFRQMCSTNVLHYTFRPIIFSVLNQKWRRKRSNGREGRELEKLVSDLVNVSEKNICINFIWKFHLKIFAHHRVWTYKRSFFL